MNAIREMFQNDSGVTVKKERSGIISVTIGKVSRAILKTKIPLLKFEPPAEQYSPILGILTIGNTAAMEQAMRKLNVNLIPRYIDVTTPVPAKGLPHLPSLMRNVTADEALDSVANTFNVIVVYGVCEQRSGARWFNIGYVNVPTKSGGS